MTSIHQHPTRPRSRAVIAHTAARPFFPSNFKAGKGGGPVLGRFLVTANTSTRLGHTVWPEYMWPTATNGCGARPVRHAICYQSVGLGASNMGRQISASGRVVASAWVRARCAQCTVDREHDRAARSYTVSPGGRSIDFLSANAQPGTLAPFLESTAVARQDRAVACYSFYRCLPHRSIGYSRGVEGTSG